jgi:protein-histidine pros-kinase
VLNSILGFAHLMLADPDKLDAVQFKQARYIHSSAEHLHSLINDVLDLARAESGAMSVSCDVFEVSALVRDLLGSFSVAAAERGNQLRAELPQAPILIDTDEGIVRQILINLVGNAIKFTSDGVITVGAAPDKSGVAIEVRDTGRGITPEEMEHLFDEFWQSVEVRRRAGVGTGLGLSICMNLAALLGGSIEVESTPGVGSTFRLSIPECAVPDAGIE